MLDRNWKRITSNASYLGIDYSEFSFSSIVDAFVSLKELNKFDDAKARISIFDLSPSSQWNSEYSGGSSMLIQTAELAEPKETLKLTISPFPRNSRSPLAAVKSCNYLENVLAHAHAVESGFDEAIRLNERGEAASACFANIFWIKNGNLFTPAIETGCLPGIMREYVVEAAQNADMRIEFASSAVEELLTADEVFLTSSIKTIAVVKTIDQKSFGSEIGSKIKSQVLKSLGFIPT